MVDRNRSALTTIQIRGDYDVGNNQIYAGEAPQGAAATDPVWFINQMTYDASGNLLLKQSATGIWSNRVSLTYS